MKIGSIEDEGGWRCLGDEFNKKSTIVFGKRMGDRQKSKYGGESLRELERRTSMGFGVYLKDKANCTCRTWQVRLAL